MAEWQASGPVAEDARTLCVSDDRPDDDQSGWHPAETARRVLQRVSNVIDYGTAAGMRSGENPCRLAILGLPEQTDEPEHFAALPYADVPKFVAKLRNSKAAEITRLAFEFLILNASRSGEVRLAPKQEFDLAKALWIIPAERMKGGREHVVPLSARAIEIVKRGQYLYPDAEFLFPSPTNPARDHYPICH